MSNLRTEREETIHNITERQLAEKDAKIERLTEVLKDLISKLDLIASDSQFQGIFILNQMHGGKYTGPTWVEELERAREAIR